MSAQSRMLSCFSEAGRLRPRSSRTAHSENFLVPGQLALAVIFFRSSLRSDCLPTLRPRQAFKFSALVGTSLPWPDLNCG
jgi:hypothetical protein